MGVCECGGLANCDGCNPQPRQGLREAPGYVFFSTVEVGEKFLCIDGYKWTKINKTNGVADGYECSNYFNANTLVKRDTQRQ